MERSHACLRLFVALVGLVASAGAARAEEAAAPAAAAAPGHRSLIGLRCKDDAAKLCAGVETGGGKLARCLRLHDNDLSEPCKGALAAASDKKGGGTPAAAAPAPAAEAGAGGMKGDHKGGPHEWGAMRDMQRTCAADVGKFCKGVEPGHGRIAACLNEHAGELPSSCKKAVETVTTQMNARVEMHADCAADIQKLCADAPEGSGRVAMCLGEHTKELSPACKKHVSDMKTHWKKHMAAADKAEPAACPPGTAPAVLPPVSPAPAPAKK